MFVTRTAPDGWQIAGFHGRSGDEVDKIGFIYTPNDVLLVNRATGKCLEVSDWSTADGADGTDIQQYSWWDNVCQRWTVLPTDRGWVRLQNPNSGKVADVADCGTADGTNVRLWSWLNNHCQQWQIQP